MLKIPRKFQLVGNLGLNDFFLDSPTFSSVSMFQRRSIRSHQRHLDWIHLESPSTANFTGILPQLWGLEARTPEVDAMLVAPSQRELKGHATHPEPEVARSC